MAKKPTPADQAAAIIAAALRLAADRSWGEIALAEIAAEAGLATLDLYRIFPSKHAILAGLSRQIDAAALAEPVDPAESPRDRLFDLLMRRFDALVPFRPALQRMAEDARRLRLDALPITAKLPRAMGWMLEAAGISGGIWRSRVRARLLGLAYIAAFSTFLDDDSADLARTMAALDRALRRIEPLLALPSEPEPIESADDAVV